MKKMFVKKPLTYKGKIYRVGAIIEVDEDDLGIIGEYVSGKFHHKKENESVEYDPFEAVEIGKVRENDKKVDAVDGDFMDSTKIGEIVERKASDIEVSTVNLRELTKKELIEIAEGNGIEIKKNMNKEQIIKLIVEK